MSISSVLRWTFASVTGLTAGWLIAAGVSAPVSMSAPTRSRPATATSEAASHPATYPSAPLARLAQQAAASWQARLDASFKILVRPPFVIAGNLPEAKLRSYAERSIVRPAEVMWASYFRSRPDEVITVLLFADAATYRANAARLFGDKDVSHFGYYRPEQRTLVMNIHTGTGTLVHELTHALIAFDWPDVPLWFNEGLASLHEQCRVEDDRIVGLPNWRLRGLQKAIRDDSLRPLADLVSKDDFYGPAQGLNYAQARYFCQHLQSRGLLGAFYREYHADAARKVSAAEVIARLCGKPVAEVDKDMRRYVLSLRWD